MSVTVSAIHDEVRKVWLNDFSGGVFTDTRLLEFSKRAWQDLLLIGEEHGITFLKTITATASPITVNIGDSELTLPADFDGPAMVWERDFGATTDLYVPVESRDWDPNLASANNIRYYWYIGQKIKFIPPLTKRSVRLDYYTRPAAITAVGNTLTLNRCELYLAPKVAAYASEFILQNSAKAAQLNDIAEMSLHRILNVDIHTQQNTPFKAAPYQGNKLVRNVYS